MDHSHDHLLGLAGILVLGVGAQWISSRLRLPSILLLLVAGFIAGPVTGFIDPDAMFGDLLFPGISLAVALVLFEGGLTLRFRELGKSGRAVGLLIGIGSIVTWAVASSSAALLFGMDFRLALLLGAILVVTGPTVITPMLRQVRPTGQVGPILKWEGILIDPLGATLALLVYEAVLVTGHDPEATTWLIAGVVGKTLFYGGAFGLAGAFALTFLLRRYWIAEHLQSPFALMLALAVFTASNILQEESGLLAVTVMGIALANQKRVDISHIVEFKENLGVLLISILFIILAARLKTEELAALAWRGPVFVVILVLIARPASVVLATIFTKTTWPERAFLAWLAPRGIVAAAVASIFSIRLSEEELHIVGAELLAPATFSVIIGTVIVYGLTAAPVARRLGLSKPHPQGLLIVGAHPWARAIAKALTDEGIDVLITDNNWEKIARARMLGLRTHYGSVLSEHTADDVDLGGIGRIAACTSNDEVNSLATLHFAEVFGRREIYQVPPEGEGENTRRAVAPHLLGRSLFGPGMTYWRLYRLLADGAEVKRTKLTKEFGFEDFRKLYGEEAVSICLIDAQKRVLMHTVEDPPKPEAGHVLISFVKPINGRLEAAKAEAARPEAAT